MMLRVRQRRRRSPLVRLHARSHEQRRHDDRAYHHRRRKADEKGDEVLCAVSLFAHGYLLINGSYLHSPSLRGGMEGRFALCTMRSPVRKS